jgi:hypothetical protein
MEHKGAIIGAKELEYVVHENREKLEHTAFLDYATVIKRLLVLLKQCYQINGNEEKRQIAAKLLDKLRRF